MLALWRPLMFVVLYVSTLTTTSAIDNILYWKSNHAGLFSQLIQTKLFYEFALKCHRKLVIDKFHSKHYGQGKTSICDFFDFYNHNVKCGTVPSGINCLLPDSACTSQENRVCINGSVDLIHKAGRMELINAMSIDLPYRVHPDKLKLFESFKKDLMDNHSFNSDFTVVHWRRGDQLNARCGKFDNSVNCKSADELISKVKQFSSDSFIYVATNENQKSSDMIKLRAAGFKTFSSVSSVASRQDQYNNLDTLSILAIEFTLMQQARIFLAWGLSGIDDIVEFERRRAKKSFCVAARENGTVVITEGGLSYCHYLITQNLLK